MHHSRANASRSSKTSTSMTMWLSGVRMGPAFTSDPKPTRKEQNALVKQNNETLSHETCAVLLYADAALLETSARRIADVLCAHSEYREALKTVEQDIANIQSGLAKLRRALRRQKRAQRKDKSHGGSRNR
jgi:hypothetical protein